MTRRIELMVPGVTYHAVVRYAERILAVDLRRERRQLVAAGMVGAVDKNLTVILAQRGLDTNAIGEYIRLSTELARTYQADYIVVDGVRYFMKKDIVITLMPRKLRRR